MTARKLRFVLVVVLTLMQSLTAIAILTPSIHASIVEDPPQHIHLTFQGDPASSITVMWQTDMSTEGTVVLYDTISHGGDSEEYLYSAEGFDSTYDGASGYIHTVELTGLDADTLYFFVCGGPDNYSSERAFLTAPRNAVDVQFVAGGDSRTDLTARTQVSQALRFTNASFVLHSGDMVEYGGTQSQWDSWFTDVHDHWFVKNTQMLPVIPCLGNHEANATQYYAQFALPENEQWYVYDWGPHLRMIVLNSEASPSQIAEDQVNWLERILYETPNDRWKIVMLHRNIYYSGSHANATDLMQSWVPLFDKYHVDLVIQGHTHHYHRTYPLYNHTVVSSYEEGTLYVTSGGWGAPLYPYHEQSYSAFGRSTHHLVVADSYQNGTLVLTAIDVNGSAFDTIRLFKAFDTNESLYWFPRAVAGHDQTVDEDSIVTFDGTQSLNSTAITSYRWTFLDEERPQTLSGAQPQYCFAQPGRYIIALNITDATGNSDSDTLTVIVHDVTAPVANAGNTLIGRVHIPVTFDASGSQDNVGIVSYDWDFGDGEAGTDISVSHTYSTSGNFTVTLLVQDAAGNRATDITTIVIESTQKLHPWMILGIGGTIVAILIGVYLMKFQREGRG